MLRLLLPVLCALSIAIGTPVRLYEERTAEKNFVQRWSPKREQPIWQLSGKFEGDMMLSKSQRNGLIDPNFRWPNNEVVYELSPDFSAAEVQIIENALTTLYAGTCVTFRRRSPSDVDYIYVTGENTGCWSYVGRNGRKQLLNLQRKGCVHPGVIAHEFLHALGFYHQQSATERDDYVDILWENISKGTEHNFEKFPNSYITNFDEEYDYYSIMHYDEYAFSSNGLPTIVPKDPNADIGQINALSDTDIIKLNKMYKCS